MAQDSAISWCDDTFNPWIGCTKVSTGPMGACEGCYAEQLMDRRLHRARWGEAPVRTSDANWQILPKLNRVAESLGKRRLVFGGSLCDVYDKNADPAWRSAYFDLIRECPSLDVLLLTKRVPNIVPMSLSAGGLPPNAALGVTAGTQGEWDRDVAALIFAARALRAAWTMVSVEPMFQAITCYGVEHRDWVVTGGGTDQGPWKAPRAKPEWFRSVRDQCASAGVAYHHKQNGEFDAEGNRVGKKAAGRELDGRTHDERPAQCT